LRVGPLRVGTVNLGHPIDVCHVSDHRFKTSSFQPLGENM
jgi:hypothetical protein